MDAPVGTLDQHLRAIDHIDDAINELASEE